MAEMLESLKSHQANTSDSDEVVDEIMSNCQSDTNEIQIHLGTQVVPVDVESNLPAEKMPTDQADMQLDQNESELDTSEDSRDGVESNLPSAEQPIDKSSAAQFLPDVIKLMSNQPDNILVQNCCHQMIDQYSTVQLNTLESTLKRSLIEVLLSAVKLHYQDSLIVENFCKLLVKIRLDRDNIDLYPDAIDCLMEIICGDNNLTAAARISTLNLLAEIARRSDVTERNSIGQKSVEKICMLIRWQLIKPEYEEILSFCWNCLMWICYKSMPNTIRFLTARGINLFIRCYKKFGNQIDLVFAMVHMMVDLSEEKPIRPNLMAKGNLNILWKIWKGTKDNQVRADCVQIFSQFLFDSTIKWPLGHPTVEEVKLKLDEDEKSFESDSDG